MKRLTIAAFGALLTALVTSGFGCELIANVDRSKIDENGGGGAGGGGSGGGGSGGAPTGGGGTGGAPQCMTPEDCEPPANECFEATCEGNVCGEAPKMAGTPVAMQTDGDCKEARCDGAGAVLDANDDADVPVDGNECTGDVCTDGAPSNPPVGEGSPCGMDGALFCNSMGQCVGCLDAGDCGADTECQTQTCDAGVCGVVNAAQGTPLAAQAAGDCKVEQCDGDGGVETADDNSDVPVDGTVCTGDVCSSGMPSNPPIGSGSMCSEGTGVLCDGNGACVECVAATDCPGVDDECQARTCTNGVCGVSFTMAGTPVMSQTAGDCKQAVCDGAGAVTDANDDADLPNDNEPCTSDTCSMGAPTFTNVMAGTSCGATQVCDAGGQCVGCNVASDCPGVDDECKTRTCNANVCGFSFTAANTPVMSQTAGDCQQNVCDGTGNVVVINANSDTPPDDGNQCTSQACSNGSPTFPAVAVNTACTQNGGSFCSAAGQCVACNQASQCPGTDTDCQARTCTNNTCGVSFTAAGTPTASQTAGDCQVNQCNGTGGVVQANANSDVPVDGQQCTSDVCTNGVPSNPPVAVNTTCTQNGGSFCSAAGQCVACNQASQCPGTDTECQTRTCNMNTCGFSFTASGTPVASQTAGDCKQNQCNGAGAIVAANFNSDVPVDGQECTGDVCTNGVPSNPPVAVNTACGPGGANFCDAAGACVQCTAASQCPGMDTECQARTCNMNTCGFSFAAAGTPVASQTAGDCKQNQCDGAGAIVAANLNSDVPVDGQECTGDVCTNGVPSNPNLPANTACSQNGGAVCNGSGACVSAACNDGLTNGDETDVDCGGSCPDCADGKLCAANADCQSGVCTGGICQAASCSDGLKNGSETGIDCGGSCPGCANGQMCNVNADCASAICNGGTCVQCVTASQCPGVDNECQTRTCNSNTCGFSFQPSGTVVATQTAGNCQQNQCNGAGGIVSVADNADLPVDGLECTGDVCTAGVPSNPPLALDTACGAGGTSFCNGAGACVQCNAASQCPGMDTECQTRTCTMGACGFSFQPNGTVVATQTAGDCKQSQCDGAGTVVVVNFNSDLPVDGVDCTGDVCTNGVPTNPALPLGTTCNQNGGTVCNGAGACVVQPTVVGTTPAEAATGVLPSSGIEVTFSTAMAPATLTAQTAAGACTGSIQVSSNDFQDCIAFTTAAATMAGMDTIAMLTPSLRLYAGTVYRIRVTTAAQSAAGIAPAAAFNQAAGFSTVGGANACDGNVVISQVYGGGGNSGATYTHDFVELHNRGTTPVNLSGTSLQYTSSAGNGWTSIVPLSGTIPAGGFFLVQLSGGASGVALPTPDLSSTAIAMGASTGKIAFVRGTTAMPTGACPDPTRVLDFVGYGTGTTCSEGAGIAAAPGNNASSMLRGEVGCADTNANNSNFAVGAVTPRNSASAAVGCTCNAVASELGTAAEADYCVLQSPLTLSVPAGQTTALVYGRIFEANTTNNTGAQSNVIAQFGYGPNASNPTASTDWRWYSTTFNVQSGNDDEYQRQIMAPVAGTYAYGYRFSLDGLQWTYCDTNGSGSNMGLDFSAASLGSMTVTP